MLSNMAEREDGKAAEIADSANHHGSLLDTFVPLGVYAILAAVIIEPIGSAISSLGVHQFDPLPAGLPHAAIGHPLPLSFRLAELTSWASSYPGLLLLAVISLIHWSSNDKAQPRLSSSKSRPLLGIATGLAGLLAAEALLGVIDYVWTPGSPGSGLDLLDAVPIANLVAGLGLGVLAFVLGLRARAVPTDSSRRPEAGEVNLTAPA